MLEVSVSFSRSLWGKIEPNRHSVGHKNSRIEHSRGTPEIQIPRACAGKWSLTDTVKRPSNDIGIKCVLLYVRAHFYRACAGKWYLTDTRKSFKNYIIRSFVLTVAHGVRSFFSILCRNMETNTSESPRNPFENHLQKSATLRTSSNVSVQYSPTICRKTIPNRHLQKIIKIYTF